MKPEVLKSWSLEIDYSRAPCHGADQKARGLWERDWIDSLRLKSHTIKLQKAKVNTARDFEWISQSLLHDWLGRF